MQSRLRKGMMVAAMASLLTGAGCSPIRKANLGIRPDPAALSFGAPCKPVEGEDSAPNSSPLPCTSCENFDRLMSHATILQEAYHSRASQNRAWIYVGGTLALGTLSATGGMGAAVVAGLSIALLSIFGGFSSGVFAILNNSELADVYTICANRLAVAIAESQAKIDFDAEGRIIPSTCESAFNHLQGEIAAASTDLETARTNNAVASVMRAQAQLDQLRQMLPTATPTSTQAPTPSPTPTRTSST